MRISQSSSLVRLEFRSLARMPAAVKLRGTASAVQLARSAELVRMVRLACPASSAVCLAALAVAVVVTVLPRAASMNRHQIAALFLGFLLSIARSNLLRRLIGSIRFAILSRDRLSLGS